MKQLILLLAIFSSCPLFAQFRQQGVVMEYQGRNPRTPLADVQITAMGSTAKSDAKGNFTLQLNTMEVGKKIFVRRVVKEGYMIFNDQAVEQWTTSNTPFQIVLCKSADFKKWVDQYYNLGLNSYKKKLEEKRREVKQLKEEGKLREDEYNHLLSEAQQQFELELQQLDGIANKFARIDETMMDSIQQQALDLIRAGEFDQAINLLASQEYSRKLQEEVEARDQATARRQEGVQIVQEAHEDSLKVMEQMGLKGVILDEKKKQPVEK